VLKGLSYIEEARERKEKFLGELASKPLTLEEIMDEAGVDVLVSATDVVRAERDSAYRFKKWVLKRGRGLSEDIRERTAAGFRLRAYVDEAMRTVLGYYGVAGPLFVNYASLGYRVMRIVKGSDPRIWVKKIGDEIKTWELKWGLKGEILKAVALASAKVTYWYKQTKG